MSKYLLSAAMIEGTELDDAAAEIPQGQVNYVVTLDFDGEGTKTFADISRALVGTEKQFAIVLDGQVLSAPDDGRAHPRRPRADLRATSPRSAPRAWRPASSTARCRSRSTSAPRSETIGPSLAGDQLTAGLLAGAIGLLLVMIYCLLYYRGLGLVVIASLLVAAAATYAMVLLLSETAGFTLTLPGIAGLIVAVGITADSFIVYFERIRDEMRDGKSMRVAVETGWMRARNTCLAADAVSLLAAVVLYIFATGVVKGFAFALGLSTLDRPGGPLLLHQADGDVAGRFTFFNSGHALSGLSAEALGIDAIAKDRAVPCGREGLMGRFARLGNDLYNGRRSIDFVGSEVALVLRLGRHRRRSRSSVWPCGASTTASSSPAARRYTVSLDSSRGHPGHRGRAA